MDWSQRAIRIFITLAFSAAAVLSSSPVQADPLAASKASGLTAGADPFASNKDVLDTCSAPESTSQYSLCLGYIHGLLRRDELLRWSNPNLAYACELPQGVGIEQLRAVIVKYLKDHPETWHWTGAGSALYAVKRAFCRPTQ